MPRDRAPHSLPKEAAWKGALEDRQQLIPGAGAHRSCPGCAEGALRDPDGPLQGWWLESAVRRVSAGRAEGVPAGSSGEGWV